MSQHPEWDNFPLNTPTYVPGLGAEPDIQGWVTRTVDGFGIDYRVQPGTPTANQRAIQDAVYAALARLRTIKTQAVAFQAQSPYVAANLANLNDLLSKSQTIAGAVSDIANDLIQLVRLLTQQYDGTS